MASYDEAMANSCTDTYTIGAAVGKAAGNASVKSACLALSSED